MNIGNRGVWVENLTANFTLTWINQKKKNIDRITGFYGFTGFVNYLPAEGPAHPVILSKMI